VITSMLILAQAAPAPTNYGSISGELIIALIGAVSTAIVLVRSKGREKQAHERGRKEGATQVEVQGDINTREHVELVTKAQLDERMEALENDIHEIKTALSKERDTARDSLGKVHARLDKVMENQANSRGELNQISLNVQRLLDITTKPPRRG
jgi:hypothetical protein